MLLNERAYWWDDVCKDFNTLCLLKVHSSKPTVTQLFVNHNQNVCCFLFVLKSLSLDTLCIRINKQIVTDDNLVNYLHFWFIFSLSYVQNSTLHYQPLCKPSSRKWFSYFSGFFNWGLLLYLKKIFQDFQTSFYVNFFNHRHSNCAFMTDLVELGFYYTQFNLHRFTIMHL